MGSIESSPNPDKLICPGGTLESNTPDKFDILEIIEWFVMFSVDSFCFELLILNKLISFLKISISMSVAN
jgi:hypothetical protein